MTIHCHVYLLAALMGAASCAQAQSARPDTQVRSLTEEGSARTLRAVLDGRAAVVMFWRSDCSPCLEEIAQIEELRRAAQPMVLITVGLESPESLRERLKQMRIAPHPAWYSLEDPGEVLATFGTVPRLPLTVAFDSAGETCALRRGVVTATLIAEWARKCVQANALEEQR